VGAWRPQQWALRCRLLLLGGNYARAYPRLWSKPWTGSANQIAAEIFDPLLCATTVEQSARTFERVFPRFRDYYASTLLLLWGFVQEDPQRFSALTIRSFEEAEGSIRSNGPRWIGQDASLNALQGLATITRVAKEATRLFDPKEPGQLPADASAVEPWAGAIVGFAMAFSAVLAALTAFSNGRKTSARLENAAALAHWSKRYAVQVYHLTKELGILRPAPIAHVGVSPSDPEDAVLAGSGLDDFAQMLAEEDRG
jgi:hypothetical protein